MGILDEAKDKWQDTGDAAKDMGQDAKKSVNGLENKAHEKKGEAQGRMDQAEHDAE